MNAPNPVQRRDRAHRHLSSDHLIAPCADEGGTFRNPAPTREQRTDELIDLGLRIALGVGACVLFAVAAFASLSS